MLVAKTYECCSQPEDLQEDLSVQASWSGAPGDWWGGAAAGGKWATLRPEATPPARILRLSFLTLGFIDDAESADGP